MFPFGSDTGNRFPYCDIQTPVFSHAWESLRRTEGSISQRHCYARGHWMRACNIGARNDRRQNQLSAVDRELHVRGG